MSVVELSSVCFLSPVILSFFNDTATTDIYTLSLHDALPISVNQSHATWRERVGTRAPRGHPQPGHQRSQLFSPQELQGDRKSTRLNSSHTVISYAVFCLKKKKNQQT